MKKSLLSVLAPVVPIAIGIGIAFASCNNGATNLDQPPPTEYAQPVVQPLKFSKPKKIDWDAIKAVSIHPLIKKFDLSKLPTESYDTAGFKPFKYSVEEKKFDYNSLPEKDLDIDKLPSTPLKFNTEKLPPPKLIKAGMPHLKDANKFLSEFVVSQGIAENFFTCLLTDREGFLWIANGKGLYRYDGENLLLYIPATTPGYNLIFSMVQDNQGRIWIATISQGYLEVLDPHNGTLKVADRSSGLNSTNSGINIGWMVQDSQQRIWVPTASSKGLGIIDPKTETIKWLDKAHNLSDTKTTCVKQDDKHNLWVASNKGLDIIDLKNKKIKYLDRSAGLASDSVGDLHFDRTGRLWLGLNDGIINIVDLQKNSFKPSKRPGMLKRSY